ncbi:hypothetical protein EYF80_064534 [Liparis tanakae]|uniref:Uncharacterized protein n=1 Tax=Liparis tanakae TaxID=230148 RepID=A0A4Z2E952_9TELE|nr:hypothetical protein EYF80_064534 [Liparis tanakae]
MYDASLQDDILVTPHGKPLDPLDPSGGTGVFDEHVFVSVSQADTKGHYEAILLRLCGAH